MNNLFWIGVYPEIKSEKILYIGDVVGRFIKIREV